MTESGQTNTQSENAVHGVAALAPPMINSVPQQPVKKPTRQWAAWTRQEEESFFTALRQVGKNFEKITRRVQSKNKDQVRHYYYRLVRRMNKLLGPGLYLDAKNSKDTNAAMLRWWSLLEKYSCKASKLHLKPRRFKIFVEALELQLLKDRKKSVRKRSLGEYCSTASGTASNQSRVFGQDNRNIKIVLIDSQNIQKIGSGKPPLKRNVSVGVNRGNNKGDSNAMKPVRQRRKPVFERLAFPQGVVSSAAYKKWEKAAIAGVSLVAEAAEHLERTTSDKEAEQDQDTSGIKKSASPVGQILHTLPPQNLFAENGVNSSTKLKLQLFPIDDGTRRALELDKHNPHLELTLSSRKKISSVLEHMNRKWGKSNVAAGELMVFPYSVQRENLVGCPRWTQDSVSSAADVFAMIGSPPVFRLRYGWFPIAGLDGHNPVLERSDDAITSSANFARTSTDYQTVDNNRNETRTLAATTTVPNKRRHSDAVPNDNNLPESSNHATNKLRVAGDMDDTRLSNGNGVSAGDWADSLTNITVGNLLLSGVSTDLNDNCPHQTIVGTTNSLQQLAFSCDSFDAAIAAHISRHRDKTGCHSALASDASSSILDAEETCDGFAFSKKRLQSQSQLGMVSSVTCELVAGTQLVESYNLDEELSDADAGDFAQEPINGVGPDNQAKNFSELADIYWPESLGPLDLDIPSAKYHSEDIILSDSLGGLNRLIASSLDAFQNCSFFGLEKKDTTSTVEVRESVSFSNFKIDSGM